MANKIAISTLPFEFNDLYEQFQTLRECGVDYAHCDIMDGEFVPNATYTPQMLAEVYAKFPVPLDVHLMVRHPMRFVDMLCGCAEFITVHCESFDSVEELKNALIYIQSRGVKSGVAVDLGTDIDGIFDAIKYANLVLIMSVKAGAGGQVFNETALDKVEQLNNLRNKLNASFLIEIDGGINDINVVKCVESGVDIIVSGSFVAKSQDISKAVKSLRV